MSIQFKEHFLIKYKASLFQKYKLETRTQDFISYYHDAAQFYVAKKYMVNFYIKFWENGLAIQIENNKVQDIDHPNDWKN